MIKFVYFDVGGVVVKDFSGSNKWHELRAELGVDATNEATFMKIWEKYWLEICVGRDVETLLPIIKDEVGLKIPDGYSLLLDGFIARTEANTSIWPAVKLAQSKARIGLLTNMYNGMLAANFKKGIFPPDIKWDIVVDSSIEKVQKPDIEFFKIAEDRAVVSGQEILFIENTPGHIEAAKKFGWQTFLYDHTDYEASAQALLKYLKTL